MSPRPLKLLALTVLAALTAGCPKPPPPAPPPEPVAEAAPPPPKCEAFSEKCAARGDTRAKITGSTLLFTPVAGWIYAQQSSSTVAQLSESGAALAFLGIDVDPKDAKKEVATKDAALAELFKQVGLNPLKRKVPWKKSDDKKAYGTVKVEFWQLEEPGNRGGKKGVLLIVAAQLAEGKSAVGVGFVPEDDKTAADAAILQSIGSLGTGK